VNKILVGAICCVILGIVVYGSIKRIAKIAEMLAPVMCGIYIVPAYAACRPICILRLSPTGSQHLPQHFGCEYKRFELLNLISQLFLPYIYNPVPFICLTFICSLCMIFFSMLNIAFLSRMHHGNLFQV
jgi:hypothetical protein